MRLKILFIVVATILLASACTISYKFNGASIDYSKTKSITILEFPNNAALVYTPLTTLFNEEIQNIYARQTRLKILPRGGDMELSGAITNYQLTPLSVASDGLAAETRLSMSVKIVYVNNVTEEEVESTFSANRTFPSSSTLNDVQDALIKELTEEIVDQIFNATVANW